MSKTNQREITAFVQGRKDGKKASTFMESKYYQKNLNSRFNGMVAPYGYARGWYVGLGIDK